MKGKSLRQVAREEGVSVDSIYFWLSRAKKFPGDVSCLLGNHLSLSAAEIQEFVAGLGEEKTLKKSENLS